jgi:hypothetical protein
MGMVMIKCPQTGREISTGMEAERDSYNRAPVFFARTFCPFCRTTHEWFARQAWVRETKPAWARDAGAARQRLHHSSM